MDTQCSLTWDSSWIVCGRVRRTESSIAKRSLNGSTADAEGEERCVFETRTTEA